jgi:hydrogenase 3 maturation protease
MTNSDKNFVTLETNLEDWLIGAKKVVVVGIGNPFRRDDSVGLKILRNLKDTVSNHIYLIEAETIPESYMQQITDFKPSHVLLIDAGIINKEAGIAALAEPTRLVRKISISTHTLPLRIFCDYITQTTKAKIALLIIQPKDTSFGEGLTPELIEAAKRLTTLLKERLP